MRVLFTPYTPPGKGPAPSAIRPEGLSQTLGVLRTLSRMVKDAARVATPFLRVCDACYGCSYAEVRAAVRYVSYGRFSIPGFGGIYILKYVCYVSSHAFDACYVPYGFHAEVQNAGVQRST